MNDEEWEYKCEGIGNIILTYRGTQQEYKRKVMRIRKQSSFEGDMKGKTNDAQNYVFTYTSRVMERLVGNACVKSGRLVDVSREFLERVNDRIRPFRPKHRLEGDPIDLSAKVVLILPDHTLIDHPHSDTFAVEIKPKWGILCRSHLVHDDHKETKFNYCRYCMHQFLKKLDGKIEEISLFCPIDLYSTDNGRAVHALTQLIHHPQNNFRVYVNSLLEWHNDMTKPADFDFMPALEQLLRKHDFHGMSDKEGIVDEFITTVHQYLSNSNVLRHLQKVQLLDIYDVEVVHKVLENLLKDYDLEQLHTMLFPFHNDDEFEEVMEEIDAELSTIDVEKLTENYHCLRFREPPHPTISLISTHSAFKENIVDQCIADEKLALHIIRIFLIAQCAKDCSIMIAFDSNPEDRNSYELGIVDLDPKPVTKLAHYSKLDKTIVQLFISKKI
jgi:inositol-pentakisphosphate 2-kinase